jgi:hypothetical protein
MKVHLTLAACLLLFLASFAQGQQSPQDEVLQLTRTWLTDISKGDRAGLNAIMEPRCFITSPAGGVLTKDRLVPDDPAETVQGTGPTCPQDFGRCSPPNVPRATPISARKDGCFLQLYSKPLAVHPR